MRILSGMANKFVHFTPLPSNSFHNNVPKSKEYSKIQEHMIDLYNYIHETEETCKSEREGNSA